MVGRFLELKNEKSILLHGLKRKNIKSAMSYRSQIEHRFPHFGQTVSRYAQNFASASHLAGQKHDVPVIDRHAVPFHHFGDFFHDCRACRFDAQCLINFPNAIAYGVFANDAVCGHHWAQSRALDTQLIGFWRDGIVDGNHSPRHIRHARNHNPWHGITQSGEFSIQSLAMFDGIGTN